MSKRVIEVEALRQVAFPDFPWYANHCGAVAHDTTDRVDWNCTRHPGHEGPHMATYEYDGDGEVIGFAWIEEEN